MSAPARHIRHAGTIIDASFNRDGTIAYCTVGSKPGRFTHLKDAKAIAEARQARSLLEGAQLKVERPRALSFTEAHRAVVLDRRYEDTDVDWNDDNELEVISAAPCSWVAQIEAAALQGAL